MAQWKLYEHMSIYLKEQIYPELINNVGILKLQNFNKPRTNFGFVSLAYKAPVRERERGKITVQYN